MTASNESGRTIVVTGASRGIGLSTVRVLLEHYQANVIAMSRTESKALMELAQRHRRNLIIFRGDISKDDDNKEVIELALRSFNNQLDGLILNAGQLGPIQRLAELDLDQARQNLDTNIFSIFSILKCAIPHLRSNRGRVIMVSSGASTGGTPGWGPYSASKASLNSICRTLGREEREIVTVALRPGTVNTEMQTEIRSDGQGVMDKTDSDRFNTLFKEAMLTSPDVTGTVLANLVMAADPALTGKFLSWDEGDLKPYQGAPPLS